MAKEILEGIRVLDMTMYQLGPVATMMLAAMGAEVIKIERPGGEPGRNPDRGAGGGNKRVVRGSDLSSYFETNNRCKKSLVLDLTKPKAKEVFYQLVAKSDVFVQNMRTGVAAKLGCDYEALKKYNSKLVYCSACSFGTKGPDASKPGMDISGCARSGWMYRVPLESGEPMWALPGSSDQIGAIFASHAIVAALLARERFGIGQEIETSHLTASMWLLACSLQMGLYMKTPLPVIPRERTEAALFSYYKCADGKWLVLACPTERHWVPICEALGIPESTYKDDPRFNTNAARINNPRETVALLDNAFAKKRQDEWIKAFEGKDIFWEKIQKIEDLPNDPQVIANEYLTDYTHPLTGETYKYLSLPMQFRETPAMKQGRAPLLGEHTEEILVDILGYKKEDMPKLLDEIGHT